MLRAPDYTTEEDNMRSDWTDRIGGQRKRLSAATQALQRARQSYIARRDEIMGDALLDDRQRQVLISRAKAEFQDAIRQANSTAEQARREGARAIERWRVTGAIVDDLAAQRVGRMLAQGISLSSIVAQARRHGDPEMLVAARQELLYLHDGRGFVESPELVQAVEDTLASTDSVATHDPDEYEAARSLREADAAYKPELDYSFEALNDQEQGAARVAYAHATGAGSDG